MGPARVFEIADDTKLRDALACGTWNVRGFTELKLLELILHMKKKDLDILCIQETRISSTSVYEEQGYLVILSGDDGTARSWAGVGIIISPRCKQRVNSHKQISDRMCSVKLRVQGGCVGIICVYAPHNLKPLDERFGFFSGLDSEYRRCSANMGKLILGDLNARVGDQQPGEEDIVGSFTFGKRAAHVVEVPNRDLLMELCQANSLLIANTFLPGEAHEKATFVEPGSTHLGPISEQGYNMLDLFLCELTMLQNFFALGSDRLAVLATDHFLVRADLSFDAPPQQGGKYKKPSVAALADQGANFNFAVAFNQTIAELSSVDGGQSAAQSWEHAKLAMQKASETLPKPKRKANQPWISDETLRLLDLRREARGRNDQEAERRLHKEARKQAKADRTRWLDKMIETGDWQQIRALRQPKRPKCRRLRNSEGELVESECWADTMAAHLEAVQWRVRPATLSDEPVRGTELPVPLGNFTEAEVRAAVNGLKKKRACGPDEVPAEYWQTIAETEDGLTWLTRLCNQCWEGETMPSDWHIAIVTALYKKGSVEDCGNYLPISLISVAYKLFATLLLKRLKIAGAERRLTTTQFGFRSGRGTNDAIFAVRRHIELALAHKGGRVGILSLDWKMAFDSINTEALISASKRFGVPPKLLRVIQHIYADRRFSVVDGELQSTERPQRSGVSQGCPLSPFLFVMLMSVVIEETKESLSIEAQEQVRNGSADILLYADDTLLVSSAGPCLQELLHTVAKIGPRYGLELHWSKFQLMELNARYELHAPSGDSIAARDRMTYLGVTIHADGKLKSELGQKIGSAWADFCKLERLWKHTSLPTHRKMRILQAVVVSKLLYGLSSAWLNKSEMRRLNGFHC